MKRDLPSDPLQLIPPDAPFTEAQRAWLNGFFAAMLSRPPACGAPAAHVPSVNLTVLHASQTGTAEGLARKLVKQAKAKGYGVRAADLGTLAAPQLADAGIVLIIASTAGEGDPPDTCAGWVDALADASDQALAGLHYAVLALGDRNYVNFCGFGHRVDTRLAELGATRLADCVQVDGATDKPFAAWQQTLWTTLPDPGQGAPGGAGAQSAPGSGAAAGDADDDDAQDGHDQPYNRDRPFGATLLANEPLNGPASDKDTRHVVLSLAGSGLDYSPGDALGIWPRNALARVQELLDALGMSGSSTVMIEGRAMSLHEALSAHREIGRVSTAVALGYLRRLPADTSEPALLALAEPEQTDLLQTLLAGKDVTDLFRLSAAHSFDPQMVVDTLAPLAPRLYSISSSPAAHPGQVHLTVGVVRIGSPEQGRFGIASKFLAHPDMLRDRVPVYLHRNKRFRLPDDPGVPVIMIGPGTGIAPFRAFLQEKATRGLTGRAWLFYGDRRRDCDFLYREQLNGFLAAGTLTRLDTAFSRDGAQKEYVQHRMLANGGELWSWIADGAVIYVCGDAQQMAKDVDATLQQIMVKHGKLSEAQAQLELRHMGANARYLRDVY